MKIELLKIEKGSFFSNKDLCTLFDREELGPFDLMRIQGMIHYNHSVTAKIENFGIRILTDQEASEYNHRQFGMHIASMKMRHYRAMLVNVSNLTTSEKPSHDRRIEIQGKYMQSVDGVTKLLLVEATRHDNILPKIF